MKKYLHRHPVDSWLEYTNFMRVGQSKLSERKSRRSGMFVPPTNPQAKIVLIVEDYGLKGIIRKNKSRVRDRPAFIFLKL